MMTEYRLVTIRQPLGKLIPAQVDGATLLTLDLQGSIPELAEQMDGWEVVNTQTMIINEDDVTPASFIVIFTMRLSLNVPDSFGE